MNSTTLKKLITAAVFAALACVATMLIQLPTVTGYVNLGDGVVLLGGFVLGPIYGFAAGGIGSMMADIITGYAYYAPGTFLIKGGVALIGALLLGVCYKKGGQPTIPKLVLCTVPAELFMAFGYFGYKALFLKAGLGALPGIPADLMQGLVGIVISVVLFRLLSRVPELRERMWKG